ncbi:GNAT family N-acetyltransferase [Nocardioides seonyuensis]|uniref:GNAT family N-acetyltransferase n=1 Tax=Nocardioides seonyuensis TaxID=2518371 RepID=A0A4P7ILA7_9ACTN|nr:GNAT family N-acetyltransferase [Nocardioides seonyuensis]QBX56861.1 GNAT family N-acetyltransferase [Nocardioides seonyuensis]
MSRSPVTVRAAEPRDVAALREVWQDALRRTTADEQRADVAKVLAEVVGAGDKMIAVAEYDGVVAGAVFLEATTLTPLNLEQSVLAVSPHVLPQFRRKGVGSALFEAAVRFAEQRGIPHVTTAATAESRDANRFMARLSLSPQATLRVGATSAVRARLTSRRPANGSAAASSRQIDRVLAARRFRKERIPG